VPSLAQGAPGDKLNREVVARHRRLRELATRVEALRADIHRCGLRLSALEWQRRDDAGQPAGEGEPPLGVEAEAAQLQQELRHLQEEFGRLQGERRRAGG
jgi:hypothetical protein